MVPMFDANNFRQKPVEQSASYHPHCRTQDLNSAGQSVPRQQSVKGFETNPAGLAHTNRTGILKGVENLARG